MTNPYDFGSGGGRGGGGDDGGAGGGYVRIDVQGKLTVNGRIAADAGPAGIEGGGGSGGSICIHAGTFAGQGALTAKGGNDGTSAFKTGGGGAGGRIAVYYKVDQFDPNGTYNVYGGSGDYQSGGVGSLFTQLVASKVGFAQQPTSEMAGRPVTPAVTVNLEDTTGAIVPSDTSTVTLAIKSGPAGAVLGGTLSVAAVSGVATFSDLTLSIPGTYTLQATDGSLTAATSVSFVISPPFSLVGTTLTVVGSEGNDTLAFVAGASTCRATINGVSQTYANSAVMQVNFLGNGGSDTITITGGTSAETAKLYPLHGTFTGGPQSVTLTSVENITINGGAGDKAYLYDSAGDDTLTGNPTYGRLSGTGFSNTVKNFPTVYAYATAGGTDTANLYDSAGNDTFAATPTAASMTGSNYYNWVKGFDKVYGYATAGGANDVANLYDSAGDDTFAASPTQASMTGAGFYTQAQGFDKTCGYFTAGGANDVARLYDSAGNDTLTAKSATPNPSWATLTGTNYWNHVNGFDVVWAYSTAGGTDHKSVTPPLTFVLHASGPWV
jgi:hypothetical protein